MLSRSKIFLSWLPESLSSKKMFRRAMNLKIKGSANKSNRFNKHQIGIQSPIQIIVERHNHQDKLILYTKHVAKNHLEKCLAGQNLCFKCGKSNHFVHDCLMKKPMALGRSKVQQATATTLVFSLTPDYATTLNDAIINTLMLL